mmetsp:Transcript_99932/g.214001  ORF Transcript_99932/g.214001 Transcript_99932/m.214001 type:complete len:238 (+) Transcript_99932:1383-2096(+)
MQLRLILLNLLTRIRECGRVEAEVPISLNPLIRKRVVVHRCEKFEIAYEGVDGKLTSAKRPQVRLKVSLIRPPPAGCDKAENISRRHTGHTRQSKVRPRPEIQRSGRHEIEFKWPTVSPGDVLSIRLIMRQQCTLCFAIGLRPKLGLICDAQCGIAIGRIVMRRVNFSVRDAPRCGQGCQHGGVPSAGTPPIELAPSRGKGDDSVASCCKRQRPRQDRSCRVQQQELASRREQGRPE